MKRAVILLFLVSFSFSVDVQTEIERWRNSAQNFTPQQAEQELKQKAGFITRENDLGSLVDPQRQQEMTELFQNFSSRAVREFTCYQVRSIRVNAQWKCSYDGRLFEDEATCRLNCVREYRCIQLPCYTVQYCTELSGGYVCPIGMVRCQATPTCPSGGSYNAQTGKCEANPL